MDNDNKRYSSILKPQKNRNPLSDLDFGNEDPDDHTANINKTARRVSFASNYIKQFVADPEKNTIWDNTYEESIEKCESSNSAGHSQANENKENTGNTLDVTSIADCNVPDNDLDLTPTVGSSNKTLNFNNCGGESIILDSIVIENQVHVFNIIGESSMELTDVVDRINNLSATQINQVSDMECTTAANFNIGSQNVNENVTNLNESMDLTSVLPIIIEMKDNDHDADLCISASNVVPNLDTNSRNSLNVLSCDDTQHLINYSISSKKDSDFSKVISGDLIPSFSNLQTMCLRGINSTSFVQDGLNIAKDLREESLQHNSQNRQTDFKEISDLDISAYTLNNEKELEYNNESLRDGRVDMQQQADNMDDPIVELSTRLAKSGVSCLDDLSHVSIVDNSDLSVNRDMNVNLTVSNRKPFWDRIVPIDVSFTNREQYEANEVHRQYMFKEFSSAMSVIDLFCKKKIDELIDMQKCLDNLNADNSEPDSDNSQDKLADINVIDTNDPVVLCWNEKVTKLFERSEGYWKIVSMQNGLYKFTTLFDTIDFTTHVDEVNGRIINIELENCIIHDSLPIALYIHQIFMEKLTWKYLKPALGEKFDILSLLDYVRITMENLLKIDTDYSYLCKTRAVEMDTDYNIKFAIVSVKLIFIWRFTINAANYDNINSDAVSYYAETGELKEREIRKCMNSCPKGFPFIRVFVESLYLLVEQLENKKNKAIIL